jgi:type IX secretion system PorP/SprF family membrane protein
MKKLGIAIALILGVGVQQNATAQQDIHFSQFFASPININPASAGMFTGDMRMFTNYRNQWKSIGTPFRTIAASVDGSMLGGSLNNGFMGWGLSFFTDKAGDSQMSSNKYNATFAYALETGNNSYLSLGLQGGLLQRTVDFGGLYWENQFNGTTFDQAVASGESFGSSKATAIDIGAGMLFYSAIDDLTKIHLGISGHHLTTPDVTFLGEEEKLYRKYTVHGGGEFRLKNTNTSFLPNFIASFQGPNRYVNLGTDVKYIMQEGSKFTGYQDEISIAFGGYYRLGDAIYATGRFNYASLSVGVSYDFNLSGLTIATSGLGGMELFLGYKIAFGDAGASGKASFL